MVQAPVILSQDDLQEKVAEVLEAVKKDQAAAGGTSAVPQIVLVPTPATMPPSLLSAYTTYGWVEWSGRSQSNQGHATFL